MLARTAVGFLYSGKNPTGIPGLGLGLVRVLVLSFFFSFGVFLRGFAVFGPPLRPLLA